MKLLDLFSGIGGFSLAAQWVWGNELEIVGFCEIDSYCQKVLNKNFPNIPIYEDITKLDGTQFKDIDIITGGFPCQDISIAGKGEGITGQRSGLWSEMHRLIGEIRPRFALIENVPMLIHRGLGRILSDLVEIGYDAEWQIVGADDVGAWHRRKRIWIVAYPYWKKRKQKQSERPDGTITNSELSGLQRKPIKEMEEPGKPTKRNRKLANTNSKRLQRVVESSGDKGKKFRHQQIVRHDRTWAENWFEVATEFCRVADGIPSRVDRLKGLGNAIVPQVAEIIMSRIKKIDNKHFAT